MATNDGHEACSQDMHAAYCKPEAEKDREYGVLLHPVEWVGVLAALSVAEDETCSDEFRKLADNIRGQLPVQDWASLL